MAETDMTPDALGSATASELVEEMKTADKDRAQAVLDQESARPEDKRRSTVVKAAAERLEVLAVPGEPQEEEPSGVWAQLLDDAGEPVLVDGNPVATELTR